MKFTLYSVFATSILSLCVVSLQSEEPATVPGYLSEYDRTNLEQNLRWILERERTTPKDAPKPRVAVYADAGVWHIGAKSIVEALEKEKIPCRVIDRTQLDFKHLEQYEGLILPGGWAPLQAASAGEKGLNAIQKYIDKGGRCLGICAGAYLVSKTVKYDGKEYPYPIGIFDGVAIGPVKDGAPFPKPGSFKLSITDDGKKRGLDTLEGVETYYSGGPFFKEGTNIKTLAAYPDGSAAVISKSVGKGELILMGTHIERPCPKDGDDKVAPPKYAGEILKKLLQMK